MPQDQRKARIHPSFSEASIFKGLSDTELKVVVDRFSRRYFDKGSFLFMEGDPAQTYYLIAEGQVKVIQTSVEGQDVIMHVLGPGELVGALPMLGNGIYPASMSTVTLAKLGARWAEKRSVVV